MLKTETVTRYARGASVLFGMILSITTLITTLHL